MLNQELVRKITLTVASTATNIVSTVAIHRLIEKAFPQLSDIEPYQDDTPKELIKYYARMLGVTLSAALVAGAITTLVTGKMDDVLFPDFEGPIF